MFAIVLASMNILAGSLLLAFGKPEERTAVFATIAYVALPPLVYGLQIGTFRYGVFTLEVMLLGVFIYAGFKTDRWWPLWAAGAQLLTCLTHFVAINTSVFQVWGAVTVRLGLWAVVSIILLLGAWEAWSRHAVVSRGLTLGDKLEI